MSPAFRPGAMRRSRYAVVRPRMVMAAAVSNGIVSGQLDQVVRRHHALGAVGAQGAAGVGHPVALGEVGDAGTDGLDDAGALDAHAGRQRGRVQPAAEVGVGEVQADRACRTRTSPGPGSPTSRVSHCMTSGPPVS